MKTWEVWLSHVSMAALTLSGGAYFWMKYLISSDDPFSVVNHPWQPSMLSLHVLAAPVLVFAAGLITKSHIQKKIRSGARTNRISGLVSTAALPAMIVSGYALQVTANPVLVQAALIVHLASSAVFVVTYLVHQVNSFRARRPVVREAALTGRSSA